MLYLVNGDKCVKQKFNFFFSLLAFNCLKYFVKVTDIHKNEGDRLSEERKREVKECFYFFIKFF